LVRRGDAHCGAQEHLQLDLFELEIKRDGKPSLFVDKRVSCYPTAWRGAIDTIPNRASRSDGVYS